MASYRIIRQNRDQQIYGSAARPVQQPVVQEEEEDERPYGRMIDDITAFNQGIAPTPSQSTQGQGMRPPPHAQAYSFGSQCPNVTGAPSHVSCWTRDAPTISTASYIPGGAIMAQPEAANQYQALFQTKLGKGTAKPRAKKSTASKPRRKIPR